MELHHANTGADLALSLLAMRQALANGVFDADASIAIANRFMSGICLKLLLEDERATAAEQEQTIGMVTELVSFASEFLEPPSDFDVAGLASVTVGGVGSQILPPSAVDGSVKSFAAVKGRVQEIIQKASVDLAVLVPETETDREDQSYSVGMLEITAMNLDAVVNNQASLTTEILSQRQELLKVGTSFAVNVKNQLLTVH